MPDAELSRRILAAVDEGFEAQLHFTEDLTRLPSLRGQEATAQDFMARALTGRGYGVDRWRVREEDIRHLPGFSPVVHASYDDAWNVVGSHRPRESRGRSLILNGHIDVVPTGPEDMWASPPFEPRRAGGWLYGRGAGDMKAGLVANVFALDALARLGLQPAAEVYIQSVVEEECTGNGALACLQRGYRAEAAIIPEPMGDCLSVAQVGVIWMQVRVAGRPAHAAYASLGFNAIEAVFPIIQALHQLEACWNADKHPRYRDHPHPINFVVSGIEGGDWTSSVPSWCTFNLRAGIYPGQDVEAARRELETVIREATRENPHLSNNPPTITYHGFTAPGYVLPENSEAEQVLQGAYRAATGRDLAHRVLTGLTDARFFGLYQDTPAMVFGPTAEDIHAFDERVEIDSIRRVTGVIALFIADWCGLETRGAP